MADLDLEIDGLADLERRLTEIAGPGARRALSKGLRQGTNVVLKEARRRVRKKTGATAKATRTKSQGQQGQDITYSVTTNYVGRFLELGTSQMPAYPFLRPATEASAQLAVQIMRDVTLAAIEIEASRK
ncbi:MULTISPECIES: HK97-gp10 family putative phage morphogenesis protein [Luteibacter]|uniref:HK97-gp10 family putative phage morphogenesis protein n=1 Tax=Luteibacter TaxID=242605 RepID=UPI00055E6AD3|nr:MULTISPECIES: HK97-gp10 family putative phage morphogenesis protein [unclassified Luteibacter]